MNKAFVELVSHYFSILLLYNTLIRVNRMIYNCQRKLFFCFLQGSLLRHQVLFLKLLLWICFHNQICVFWSVVVKYWCILFLPPSTLCLILNIFNTWTNEFFIEGCVTSYIVKMKYSWCTEFTSNVILSNGTVYENKTPSFDSKNYLFQAV